MTSINNLSSTDTIYAGDLLPVWRTANGDTRKMSMTTLTAYLNANLNPTSLSNPVIANTEPRLDFYETDGDVDEKRTTLTMDAGSFNLQTRTDADVFGQNFMRVLRDGVDITEIQLNGPVKIATESNTDPNIAGRGLHIVQTGPTSGSAAGESYYNFIDVVTRSARTGPGDHPGNPGTPTWSSFQISHNAGGPNFFALGTYALSAGIVYSLASPSSTSDMVGISGGAVSEVPSNMRFYGICSAVTVQAQGGAPTALSFEADFFAYDDADYGYGVGVNSWTAAEVDAQEFTTAFNVGASGAAEAVKWDYAFTFATFGGDGGIGLKSTGTVFYAEDAMQVVDVFAYDLVTITGDFIRAPNIELTGGGALTLGGPISFQGTSTFAGIINGAPQIEGNWVFAGNPRIVNEIRYGSSYTIGSDGARILLDTALFRFDNFETDGFVFAGSGFSEYARINSSGLSVVGTLSTSIYTVGTLPAASTTARRALVSDANATTFASVAAGGGSNRVPVYEDGASNWRIG